MPMTEPRHSYYLDVIRRPPRKRSRNSCWPKAARARRPRRGAQARHQPSPPGLKDRHQLSRLRLFDPGADRGGQFGTDAGGQSLRPPEGFPLRHLRHVVHQGAHPGKHPAFAVAGEDGHHCQDEKGKMKVLCELAHKFFARPARIITPANRPGSSWYKTRRSGPGR